jgi:hypothetical protein
MMAISSKLQAMGSLLVKPAIWISRRLADRVGIEAGPRENIAHSFKICSERNWCSGGRADLVRFAPAAVTECVPPGSTTVPARIEEPVADENLTTPAALTVPGALSCTFLVRPWTCRDPVLLMLADAPP